MIMKTLQGARRFICALFLAQALLPSATGLFAQTLSLSGFEFELSGSGGDDGGLAFAGALKVGAAASFGSHFNLSAGVELASSNILSLFYIKEENRTNSSLKVTSVAMEFPFADGWTLTPAVFLGEYADVASGGLLAKALKIAMRPPEFLRYGQLSVFSSETNTQGLGAGLSWSARKRPLAVAAYAAWNGDKETPGFNVYAETAGAFKGISWNVFAILGRGEEDGITGLAAQDFYASGGFSALVEGEGNLSLYMQAKILPFRLGSTSYFTENIESRVHFLFEPRYRSRFFASSATFFVSPVMQDKDLKLLDIEEGVLYAGLNLSLEAGRLFSQERSLGINATLLADTSSTLANSWNEILNFYVSPFFKFEGAVFTLTASVFLNLNKISSPLSAGEINLHIEATL